MTKLKACLFLALGCLTAVQGLTRTDGERAFDEICVKHGFNHEKHTVVTDDGYILTLFRIHGKRNDDQHDAMKAPVLFQHGIFDSAYAWIMAHGDEAPAFMAAHAGYDVWLGNSRGNTFSHAHVSLDPGIDANEFWDFSWHEMGRSDLPAVINYIQHKTNYQKIAYIGHSLGTTQMFDELATREDDFYADKISIFIALAPMTKIPNADSPIIDYIAQNYFNACDTADLLGMLEVFEPDFKEKTSAMFFCKKLPALCEMIDKFQFTKEPKFDDPERKKVFMHHFPHATSLKTVFHYIQNAREKVFQHYVDDYCNVCAHKGSKKLNHIPIETIDKIPIALFAAKHDPLADLIDVHWIRDQVCHVVHHYQEINGGHHSFLIGKDMSYFKMVLHLLEQHHPFGHHPALKVKHKEDPLVKLYYKNDPMENY